MLIAHIVFCIPYVIFSVLPKLRQVNYSKYEAAQDLGATPTQALIKVIIPDIMPGIVSGFILAFTLSIDDFVVSFFTTGNGVQNLSTIIYSMSKRGIKSYNKCTFNVNVCCCTYIIDACQQKSGEGQEEAGSKS